MVKRAYVRPDAFQAKVILSVFESGIGSDGPVKLNYI